MSKKSQYITWTLLFEGKKIILKTPWESFFVRGHLDAIFLHGDLVSAKILKKALHNRMAEVRVIRFLGSTTKTLLGEKIGGEIFPLKTLATREKITISDDSLANFSHIPDGTLVEFSVQKNIANIQKIFENQHHDQEIGGILFANNIVNEWNSDTITFTEQLDKKNSSEIWEKIDNDFRPESLIFSEKWLSDAYKIDKNLPYFSSIFHKKETRVDMRNWYTLTIDGADARDLDDAISIAKYDDGNFLLGVHIADVSFFVREDTPADHAARKRGTSVYLPDMVIPMLPETLSNHLCSLTPDTEKKTLTVLMKIHKETGRVIHTDIFQSMIQSRHRGVYDDIFEQFSAQKFANPALKTTIQTAFELFDIVSTRRKKEGKITFDMTELYFHFGENATIPESITKRIRNDAHLFIEEYMVLANEEVAKWCSKRKIPFLSRFHDAPSDEWMKTIANILQEYWFKKIGKNGKITPKIIRNFLENLDEKSRYHASKLILPKMSKAIYSSNQNGHFGLSLRFYSHFTSPIRRYPDLITHRMIRAYLNKKLDANEKNRVKPLLEKIAEISTQKEKWAENTENIVDKIYTLRFMESHIGEEFSGKISGVSEWWFFVELALWVEITVYLPRDEKFFCLETTGIITNQKREILWKIGQEVRVVITKILKDDYRIVGEIVQK